MPFAEPDDAGMRRLIMPLNGKFIEKYGKSWMEMDNESRWMAVMSEIFDIREAVEPVKKTCKIVDRHSFYFTALWIVLTLILIPIFIMATRLWLGL